MVGAGGFGAVAFDEQVFVGGLGLPDGVDGAVGFCGFDDVGDVVEDLQEFGFAVGVDAEADGDGTHGRGLIGRSPASGT